MLVVIVCREMHWTYQDYLAQPAIFIRNVVHMLKAEGEERERRSKAA